MIDPDHPALKKARPRCLAYPDVTERLSHGTPTWFIGGKRPFACVTDNHHDDGRLALICAAPPGVQQTLVEADPERFFRPPYVGVRGWLGVRLDRDLTWEEVGRFIADAYATVAPPPKLRAKPAAKSNPKPPAPARPKAKPAASRARAKGRRAP